ncbi:MAG: hypothetical protein ACI9QL_002958 [Candidatus Omnitrophota bacterium]|jgi:hypothetical protein
MASHQRALLEAWSFTDPKYHTPSFPRIVNYRVLEMSHAYGLGQMDDHLGPTPIPFPML